MTSRDGERFWRVALLVTLTQQRFRVVLSFPPLPAHSPLRLIILNHNHARSSRRSECTLIRCRFGKVEIESQKRSLAVLNDPETSFTFTKQIARSSFRHRRVRATLLGDPPSSYKLFLFFILFHPSLSPREFAFLRETWSVKLIDRCAISLFEPFNRKSCGSSSLCAMRI